MPNKPLECDVKNADAFPRPSALRMA